MKTLVILGFGTVSLSSYAQTFNLRAELPVPSLTIEKVGINKEIPTDSVIDLRDLLDAPIPSLRIMAVSNEEKTFQVLNEEALSKYKLSNDSIWLYEKETPLTKLVYNQPELMLTFPLTEKHIIGSASGKGQYADKLPFTFNIIYESTISLSNDIIMPDGSRLNNVYRVKTTHKTSYSDFASDSIGNTIKEVENSWYLQGELFPILSSYEIANDSKSHKSCYYVTNAIHKALQKELSEKTVFTNGKDNRQYNCLSLEYKISNQEATHEINIIYSSKDNTNVSFTVASINGIIYKTNSYAIHPNEKYTYHFNYSHLPRGEYAVMIVNNNQQFNFKFNVK